VCDAAAHGGKPLQVCGVVSPDFHVYLM
jgi:hypothetical protein